MTLQLVESEQEVKEYQYPIEVGDHVDLEPDVDDDVMTRCVALVRNYDRLEGWLRFRERQYRLTPWTANEQALIRGREKYALQRTAAYLKEELERKVTEGELSADRAASEWRMLARVLLILGLFRLHLKPEHLTWLCVQTGLSHAEVHRLCRNARRNRERHVWLAS